MFQGEQMTCIMCGKTKRSDPRVESNWRAIVIEGKRYYACSDEFPADGASRDDFRVAYIWIFATIMDIDPVELGVYD